MTGLAIQVELGGGAAAARYCFVTLDDGSGRTINVKITRRAQDETSEMEFPSNTTVDELNIEVKLGLPTIFIDKHAVSVGQCVRVRGTIDAFRGNRQLDLKRIKMVTCTADESKSWAEVAQWHRDILAEPWVLTTTAQEEIDADLEAESRRLEDRSVRKRAWHARRAEKQSLADRKAASKLKKLEAAYNDGEWCPRACLITSSRIDDATNHSGLPGALPGSDIIKAPWD